MTTFRLQDLQRATRAYESLRDRHRQIGGEAIDFARLQIAARETADAAVAYLADRRRRRQKENKRRGIGPDDVKRLTIANEARASGGSRG